MKNRLQRLPFRTVTGHCIALSICPGNFVATIDLSDADFHLVIDGFSALPSRGLPPLRVHRQDLNYLEDWILLGHSPQLLSSHIAFVHLRRLGVQVKFPKCFLTPAQEVEY